MSGKDNVCFVCGKPIKPTAVGAGVGTGYGTDKDGNRICYECCGDIDRLELATRGKGVLYLSSEPNPYYRENSVGTPEPKLRYYVSNWPGTLKIRAFGGGKGRHNIAGVRYDVWFDFQGFVWHGVQYGDNTELCYVKRTKRPVPNREV